jgi:adenine-specific DNA-methyltransferase
VEKALPVLVGDANGADKALQEYFHKRKYKPVIVFCTGGVCRNNVGDWEQRSIPSPTRARNAEFYSAKDKVMADESTIGLMVWDGKSVGTLMNIYRLLAQDKNAVLYSVPEQSFIEFKQPSQWEMLLAKCDSSLRQKLEQRVVLEKPGTTVPSQASLHI